ncbi:MAG: cob(I)yrinic acid a,c-diamide adenosyltransferase [Salibacteraceae bacterium]
MKVYTKTGDKGKTSLFGGKRVLKNDLQIESYGNVDELNSWMGILRDLTSNKEEKAFIVEIQENLFTIGSYLATDPAKKEKLKLPSVSEDWILQLENSMDKMDANLPPMQFFVLPGGHKAVSNCHVARTVCRRAERSIVALESEDEDIDFAKRYVNRLSDYLFVLSRKWAVDFDADEIPWKPKKE